MKRTVIAVSALALTTACIPPQGVSQADLVSWDNAVASMGCDLVSEREYVPVELQTGFTREKLIEIAQYKVTLGEAANLSNGGVRLVTGPCAPAQPVATPEA